MEKLLYDIEVFSHDSFVVFKDLEGNIVKIYHRGENKSSRYETESDYETIEDLITGKILIGFNNYFYDDIILTCMMNGKTNARIKMYNDTLINGGRIYDKVHPTIRSWDCFKQLGGFVGLKQIEANLGMSIKESTVPFDVDRPLTTEEIDEVIDYCSHDVSATGTVYDLRDSNYFQPKIRLLDMLPEHLRNNYIERLNTTSISATMLLEDRGFKRTNQPFVVKREEGESLADWRERNRIFLEEIDLPSGVIEMWDQPFDKRTKKKTIKTIYGAKFEFSFGGLHGVNTDGQKIFKNVILLDVESLYPMIMILYRMLGESTDKFEEIVRLRLKVKYTDKLLQSALKLIINSTYGMLIDKYSKLYNPYVGQSVCMIGQIALYDLCRDLYEQCNAKLININTDGVAFTCDDDSYKEVAEKWQEKWGLNLSEDFYETFIQQNVNNYIGVERSGKIKAKGGDVKKFDTDYFLAENSLRITDICIVNYFLEGKSPLDSILENIDNPLLFQIILKTGHTYQGTCDENGNLLNTKINRVFACRENVPRETYLMKLRPNGKTENFPLAPRRMYVHNEDLKDFTNFEEIIDLQYYIDLAQGAIERWK